IWGRRVSQQERGKKKTLETDTQYQIIEKLVLALVTSAKRLRPYFHSHTMVLRKLELRGRMIRWIAYLSHFSLKFKLRGEIKSQALSNFIIEMWTLYVDGLSNSKGGGADIILEGLREVEYGALLEGLSLALELVAKHIRGTYQIKDNLLLKYSHKVVNMLQEFEKYEVKHIPGEDNSRVDGLSKLATIKATSQHRSIFHKTMKSPSIEEVKVANEEVVDRE
ncbi:hypothetical protein CR513_06870, partial [Mucuna pruriens]